MIEIKMDDNTAEVKRIFKKALQAGLKAIGLAAEKNAKDYEIAVDTGRLRNSITWATKENAGTTHEYQSDSGEGFSETRPDVSEKEVIIGTAVEYAEGIENGSHRKAGAVHFLQRAATQHSEEYKGLLQKALEAAQHLIDSL